MLNIYFAGLRIYNGKCHCQVLEHSQKEMNQGTDTWLAGYVWLFAGEEHYSFQGLFPKKK